MKLTTELRPPFRVPSALRLRIIFFLAVVVTPLTCLSFYLALDERGEEDAGARADEKAIVREVTTDLDRLFQLSRSLVAGISYQRDATRLCGSLDAMRSSFPEFFNLGLYDVRLKERTAESICGLVATGERFALAPDEDRIAAGLRTRGDISVAPVRVSVLTGKPVIPILSLMEEEPGGIRRMVSVSVNLAWLTAQINRVTVPRSAVLLVLDRNGVIAARNPVSAEWSAGKPAPEFERTLPARPDFNGEIVGDKGISRYYTLAHVGGSGGMAVVLKMQTAEIFRRSRERLILRMTGLFIVSSLVFGVAWTSTEAYVARPLERLARAASLIAAGDLSGRSGLEYKGEIGRMAQSFDAMADSLQRDETRNTRMLEALQALTGRLESVGEEERARIAREIHDELGQQLTAVQFELATLALRLADTPHANRAADLTAMVEAAIRQLRRIATDLRPAALDYGGVVEAIDWLARDFGQLTGVRYIVNTPGHIEASDEVALCLFRICQESLTNIARHSGATDVRISLESEDGCYVLTVRDNGRGFRHGSEADKGSLGLLGMGERARIACGTFSVTSAPGEGTMVVARIPQVCCGVSDHLLPGPVTVS